MAIGALYKLYAVSTPGGLIDGISSFRENTNDEEVRPVHDGQVDPMFVAMMSQMASVQFTSVKLATALGITGIGGSAITSTVSTWWQKMAQGGTREGSSAHIKATSSTGMIVPQQIQARQGDVATIDYEYFIRSSDGETDPVTIATGQSLTGTPDTSALYTVGPVKYNTTLADDVEQITVDFGNTVEQYMGGGHVYPTFISLNQRMPSISVVTSDLEFALSTIGRAGRALSSGALMKVWFRAKSAGGANVAAATTSHILLTINEGRISLLTSESDAQATGRATLRITPTYDGTNAIMAVTAGAAIA